MDKIERGDEPIICSLSDGDKEMNSAIKLANKTLDDFDKALKSAESENFALKIRYDLNNI